MMDFSIIKWSIWVNKNLLVSFEVEEIYLLSNKLCWSSNSEKVSQINLLQEKLKICLKQSLCLMVVL